MEKINKIYMKNKKEKFGANKISKNYFTPILKISLALALFFIAAFMISGAGIIAENGALNVSNNLFVDTNTLFADSVNNRIGIGTTSPGSRFHVNVSEDANTIITVENPSSTGTSSAGVLRAKSDTAVVNFQAHGSARTLSRFGIQLGNWSEFLQVSGEGLIIGTLAGTPFVFGTNSAERMRITSDGKVGIGTSSPASTLTVIGNFSATGTKSAVIDTSQGAVAFYAMESTEVRLYDEGKSILANGIATVALDPLFAEVIDTSDYIVHITPRGSSNGLYAEQQTPAGFVVKENNGGTGNIEFSYLISGKRKDFKDVRLHRINNFDFGGDDKDIK